MAKIIQIPRDVLFPYQLTWVRDKARFKIGNQSRQTGKDFASACEAVEECHFNLSSEGDILSPRTEATQWTILATGERQALESVLQAKLWAEAYKFAIVDIAEDRAHGEALLKSAEIQFANGSRLRALPANPATCRGLSTSLILTEFAFHENPDAIWRAIYPSLTNPLRGGEKKLRIISTPNGLGNKFADIWTKNYQVKDSLYSCHKVTIEDAVKDGLPVDIEKTKAGMDDPDGWPQEYMCEFIDSSAILLPYELIALCESPEASAIVPFAFWEAAPANPRFMGIDFGRKRDLTVAWTAEKLGDVLHTREVLELAKTSTPDQEDALRPRLKHVQRACLDYTGPGVGLGDHLVKEFGEWDPEHDKFGKIQLCTFTPALKQEIFPKMRMAFESRGLRIPPVRALREDLHSVYRQTGKGGNVGYAAPHSDDGHADRATALALMIRAAAKGGLACGVGRRFRRGTERPRSNNGRWPV